MLMRTQRTGNTFGLKIKLKCCQSINDGLSLYMRIFQEKNEMINPKGKAWKPIKEGRRREEKGGEERRKEKNRRKKQLGSRKEKN